MEKLLEILKSLHPRVDFANETGLVDRGILDSFDVIALVGEMNDLFGVEVDLEYLEPENFNTVDAMAKLLRKLGATL
ncbi:MAG: phosphopantetheine-binding protein [Oscillospiraceae bacterium]|jgi:acyl carrier protein|nr:phosphopantetheine-binding protein [Oscillospiraceae bacterium]